MKRLSQEEVQNRIDKAHGKGVFIIKEEYVNRRTKTLTLHTKCGKTRKADTSSLTNGHGCPYCSNSLLKTQEQFEKEVYELVGEEYKVLSEYKGTHEVVTFKHNVCGNVFEMAANAFLGGQRCPNERYKRTAQSNMVPLDEAKDLMHEATNGGYEIIGNYKGLNPRKNGKADILHRSCGNVFKVQPGRIIRDESGCPKCSESRGERYVNDFLVENGFDFEREYRIKECRNIRPLPFDFAVFDNGDLKCLIEYDGEQHFKPKFGKKNFEKTLHNDAIKDKFCEENNIDLIKIPYKRSYTNASAKEYVYNVLYNKLIPIQA